MKTTLLAFLFVASAFAGAIDNCTEDGAPGQWVWATVCPPGHGAISFYVCATSGSCPGSAWCPGNNGCSGITLGRTPLLRNPNQFSKLSKQDINTMLVRIQQKDLEILVAQLYRKKEAKLSDSETRTPFPRTLLAHGATAPPPDDDEGNSGHPACSSCTTWDIICWLTCTIQ